jgi:hypothetical protein
MAGIAESMPRWRPALVVPCPAAPVPFPSRCDLGGRPWRQLQDVIAFDRSVGRERDQEEAGGGGRSPFAPRYAKMCRGRLGFAVVVVSATARRRCLLAGGRRCSRRRSAWS